VFSGLYALKKPILMLSIFKNYEINEKQLIANSLLFKDLKINF
jgi:hypothetical protein